MRGDDDDDSDSDDDDKNGWISMRKRRWRVRVCVLDNLSNDDDCIGEDGWMKRVGVGMKRKERR
jgi:hypothetical protein